MIEHPARFLFIGAATKTGKTIALELRAVNAILEGRPVAWSGSLLRRTMKTYRRLKQILAEPIERGVLVGNDSSGTIFDAHDNPRFVSFTGEHPDAIYGDGYHLFIIDEASRQPAAVYTAALTTTTATRGSIVCAFNLDHGAHNWAIRKLLEVEAMTEEERRTKSQAAMRFPTLAEPWCDPLSVDEIRAGMPQALFDALYNAVIPRDDVALFPNLDELWTGAAPKEPELGHTYIMGVDLGRKHDFTVGTVLDVTRKRFVAAVRLYKVGWTVQYERIAELYRRWHCARAWVDQTGLGDPVVEELSERGMTVEGYIFTEPSRKALVEGFAAACDGKRFTVADTDDLAPHKRELDCFEVAISKTAQAKITYRVQEHEHDDAAFSMMLAWFGSEAGNFGPPRIESLRRERPGEDERDGGLRFGIVTKRDLSGF
jgi:hypothetical protein